MFDYREYDTPSRREAGYVIVLPGVDGLSWCNKGVVQGLVEAGSPYAIELYDWTLGIWLWMINLRYSRRHQWHVDVILQKIQNYQDAHPGRPVHLVGHSAGAAMILLTLEKLPEFRRITSGILLAPAISSRYKFNSAPAKTELGLWNFKSWGDAFFLGFVSSAFGTVDGRHGLSAGMCGFHDPNRQIDHSLRVDNQSTGAPPVMHEIGFRPEMVKVGSLGGHFGCVNPLFIQKYVAPILRPPGSAVAQNEAALSANSS